MDIPEDEAGWEGCEPYVLRKSGLLRPATVSVAEVEKGARDEHSC